MALSTFIPYRNMPNGSRTILGSLRSSYLRTSGHRYIPCGTQGLWHGLQVHRGFGFGVIQWMEERLHHLGSTKQCSHWGIRYTRWCKISYIHSRTSFRPQVCPKLGTCSLCESHAGFSASAVSLGTSQN